LRIDDHRGVRRCAPTSAGLDVDVGLEDHGGRRRVLALERQGLVAHGRLTHRFLLLGETPFLGLFCFFSSAAPKRSSRASQRSRYRASHSSISRNGSGFSEYKRRCPSGRIVTKPDSARMRRWRETPDWWMPAFATTSPRSEEHTS